MADLTLTKTRLISGRWEGVLDAGPDTVLAPQIAVSHLDTPVEGVTLNPDAATAGRWFVEITLPETVMTDGIQTVLVSDAATGETLEAITLLSGEPLDHDIRAEIDLLRAELDMLKKAFRRHCVETAAN